MFLEVFIGIFYKQYKYRLHYKTKYRLHYKTKYRTRQYITICCRFNYNDHYILIVLNIFYIHNINYSYKCLKLDHFLINLVSLKHLFLVNPIFEVTFGCTHIKFFTIEPGFPYKILVKEYMILRCIITS